MQWSPESSSLAFGTYGGGLNVLDVDGAGSSVADAARFRADRPGVQIPLWSGSGELFVVDVAGAEANMASPLLVVDPVSGAVTETVVGDTEDRVVAVSDDGQTFFALWPAARDEGGVVHQLDGNGWAPTGIDDAIAVIVGE